MSSSGVGWGGAAGAAAGAVWAAAISHTRLDQAERALVEALHLDPQNAYAKRNLAAVLGRSGRNAEALPLFRLGMDVAQRLGAVFMLPGNSRHACRSHYPSS